jgi:two-component system, LuxR family, sensor kinase FixL
MAQLCLAELNGRDHIRGIDNAANAKSSRSGKPMVFAAMLQWAQSLRSKPADGPLGAGRHAIIAGFLYLIGYVVLDPVGIIGSKSAFAIPAWNPQAGLSFVLILLCGLRLFPFLFIAPLLADIVNQPELLSWQIEILSAFLIGTSYSVLFLLLSAPKIHFRASWTSMRDLVLLMFAAAAVSSVVAPGAVGLLILSGSLSENSFIAATVRYWLADMIGILGVTPFALLLWDRRPALLSILELAAQYAAIVAGLVIVFGIFAEQEFQLFYILFLPIVWMAARGGIEAVDGGILFLQVGWVLGLQLFSAGRQDMAAFQAMILVLTVTGLALGVLVTASRRTEVQLRLHRESLARLGRLANVGELAAAIAHEVNQPLTAAGTYMRVALDAIGSDTPDIPLVEETATKAAAEVDRAALVIRRLRALVTLDRSNREQCKLHRIIQDTIKLCQPDLDRSNVKLGLVFATGAPTVMIDVLQFQQVLLNLIRNSIEAIAECNDDRRRSIWIKTKLVEGGFVEIEVADSGPGFPSEFTRDSFLPLTSTKPGGLGIGLPLCTTIVEAHGGTLWFDIDAPGGAVHFTLPNQETAVP